MTRHGAILLGVFVVSLCGCGRAKPAKPTMSFHKALHEGNVAEVESNLFWERGKLRPTVNGRIDKTGRTPLHVAAEFGHMDLAEFLIGRGSDVNSMGYGSCQATPLQVAEAVGDETMAELLRRLGATDLPASDSSYLEHLKRERQEQSE